MRLFELISSILIILFSFNLFTKFSTFNEIDFFLFLFLIFMFWYLSHILYLNEYSKNILRLKNQFNLKKCIYYIYDKDTNEFEIKFNRILLNSYNKRKFSYKLSNLLHYLIYILFFFIIFVLLIYNYFHLLKYKEVLLYLIIDLCLFYMFIFILDFDRKSSQLLLRKILLDWKGRLKKFIMVLIDYCTIFYFLRLYSLCSYKYMIYVLSQWYFIFPFSYKYMILFIL